MGDSITFGFGCRNEETWVKTLQEMLTANSGKKYFLINAGGPAENTHKQLEFYKNYGANFGQEMVIIGFCLNDVSPCDIKSDLKLINIRGKIVRLLKFRYYLTRSYCVALIDSGIKEGVKWIVYDVLRASKMKEIPFRFNAFGVSENSEQAWQNTLSSLKEIRRLTAENDQELLIVVFPYQFMISDSTVDNRYHIDKNSFTIEPIEKLKYFCDKNKICMIDLTPAFKEERESLVDRENTPVKAYLLI